MMASDGILQRPIVRKFIGYLAVGGSAAIIDLGAFVLLHSAGAGLIVSAALAFAIAAVFNFSLSAKLVFQTDASRQRFVMFIIFAIVGMLINTGVTALAALGFGILPALAKILGIGIAFIFNFAINTLVVFAKPGAR